MTSHVKHKGVSHVIHTRSTCCCHGVSLEKHMCLNDWRNTSVFRTFIACETQEFNMLLIWRDSYVKPHYSNTCLSCESHVFNFLLACASWPVLHMYCVWNTCDWLHKHMFSGSIHVKHISWNTSEIKKWNKCISHDKHMLLQRWLYMRLNDLQNTSIFRQCTSETQDINMLMTWAEVHRWNTRDWMIKELLVFFKWLNNKEGTTGYVMVSATNERDVKLIQNVEGKDI